MEEKERKIMENKMWIRRDLEMPVFMLCNDGFCKIYNNNYSTTVYVSYCNNKRYC